jgi:1-acyl-sn-glycerol-3-phosphate acyltransferase
VSRGPAGGRDRIYRVVVYVASAFLRLMRIRRTVTGVEHVPTTGGAVLAISHFGYLDFAIAEHPVWWQRGRCARFLATKAAFKNPFVGWIFRAVGHIPVDRQAGSHAYDAAVGALQSGELVAIFPESRVTASFTLLPFKTGAVRMAAAAGVPVVPCVVWGGHRVHTRTKKLSFRRAFGTQVSVLFSEPMTFDPAEDAYVGTERLRDRMASMLETAMDGYPDGLPAGEWWVPAHRGGGAPAPDAQERRAS